MILGVSVLAGIFFSVLCAKWHAKAWQPPALRHAWLVIVFFLPQFLAFYLPATRDIFPNQLVAASLVISQLGLLAFCLRNWRATGMPLLALGLLLNLVVILANGGFMPISIETVAQLVPADVVARLPVGERLGVTKDILLAPEAIVFPWLADRFVPPVWFPYRFAFSAGDVFIGLGAFIILAFPAGQEASLTKGSFDYVNQSNL